MYFKIIIKIINRHAAGEFRFFRLKFYNTHVINIAPPGTFQGGRQLIRAYT